MTTDTATAPESSFRLYVGNLSYATDEAALRKALTAAGCGDQLESATISMRPVHGRRRGEDAAGEDVEEASGEKEMRSRGYGFVQFASKSAMDKARAQLSGMELDGRTLIADEAHGPKERTERAAERKSQPKAEGEQRERAPRKPRAKKPAAERAPRVPDSERTESTTTVFISNLPFSTTADQLASFLGELSLAPVKLTLAERRFKSGETRSKGFAFAEYTSQDEQIKVVAALDGKEIEGRVLAVKNAMERLAGADE